MADERRLYGDLAWTWPLISPPEEYEEESERVVETVRRTADGPVATLLHMACGGGHNDHTLQRHLRVTGLDVSEEMLALARALNPGVEYVQGDVRTARLRRTFDAVAFLDSAIYMATREDLLAALVTAREHLRRGGALHLYVEETRERYEGGRTTSRTVSGEGVELAFLEYYYDPDPGDETCEATFVYMVRRGGEVEVHTDHHLFGLFGIDTWRELLVQAGLRIVEELPDDEEGLSGTTLLCRHP